MNRHTRTFFFLMLAIVGFLLPLISEGQITVSVTSDRDRYICFEPIMLTINLQNRSGHSLYFGDGSSNDGYIYFHIKNPEGYAVKKTDNNINPLANLTLPAGATKSVTIPISNYFAVQDDDDYELKVRVGHKRLLSDFLSKPITFQVRKGVSIWESFIGVPGNDSESVIKMRKCSLNIFYQNTGAIYYLQLEDDSLVYTVSRLGRKVLGTDPQCDIDALSRIHTLIQTVPRLFQYRVFDHNGKIKVDNTYIADRTTPKLLRDPDVGRVMLSGGKLAVAGVDYNVQPGKYDARFNSQKQKLP